MHSKIGPSSAHRWINCPGSIRLVDALPLRVEADSEFAKEGTDAHAMLEYCLANDMDAWEAVTPTTPDDMAGAVQVAIDYVRKRIADMGNPLVFLEVHIDLAGVHPDMFGTADVVLVQPSSGHVVVIDYKHGAGIAVDATDNPQLRLYAYGAKLWLEKEVPGIELRTFETVIVQPRGGSTPVKHGNTDTTGDLQAFIDGEVLPSLALADGPSPTFAPGEHCRFCPARAWCPALAEACTVNDGQAAEDLAAEVLGVRLSALQPMLIYKKALETEVHARLASRKPVEGWMFVDKRSVRQWRDPKEAEAALVKKLGEGAYKKELLSVAAAEKLLDKDDVKELSFKPDAGRAIAPATDGRPARSQSAADMFKQYLIKE